MARLVKRTRSGPYEVKVGGESKWICGCGLSNNQPYCDGTHKTTRDEAAGKHYWYDAEGHRHEIADSFPNIKTPAE